MEYRSLKGDFGVFSGEINFKSGLNTVFAENESGKSTFCAFTKAMLYGVSTSQRETADRLPDKVKYLPWSGRPMNGRLVLHKDGRDIVLSRTSEHGPLKDFTAVYADTSEPVLGLDGSNAGEVLCGVDAEVFEKTAFCSADSLAVKNSEALEAAVAAAIGAGGEESSPSTADARLAAWQRERKNGKKGRIPLLEEEITSLEGDLAAVEEKNREILALSAEIKTLRAKKLVLETELAASEDRRKNRIIHGDLQQKYDELNSEVRGFINEHRLTGARCDAEKVAAAEKALRISAGLEAERRQAEAHVYKLKAEYASGKLPEELQVFEGCSPEYAVAAAEKAKKRHARLMATGPKYWLFIISALLIAAGIVILVMASPTLPAIRFPAYVCFGAAVITTVLGISGTVTNAKNKREAREMLAKWGCRSPEQFRDIARAYEHYCRGRDSFADEIRLGEEAVADIDDKLAFRRRSAKQYIYELGLGDDPLREVTLLLSALGELDRMKKKLSAAEGALIVYNDPAPDSDSALRPAHEKLCAALRNCELALERKKGEQAAIGSADEISAGLEAAKAELEKVTREYNAILSARQLLAVCGEEFSREMTPKIASRAEEIFARLTNGRYGELQLTRSLEASAVPAGEAVARRLISLSRGAIDQAWLAVRLVLSEALCTSETVPLVLDDVLAMYDDERAETALKFFGEASKNRQIILFTCRRRDALLTEKYGGNLISL